MDTKNGLYQAEVGSDGIGDVAYIIDMANIDIYPLMGMYYDFNTASEHSVQSICNSSISDFQWNSTAISFYVSGENDTTDFCRICIPKALMNDTYRVFVNGIEISYNLLPFSNNAHSNLYFIYSHSKEQVVIIPEFPIWASMLLILILFTVALTDHKRSLLKT